MRFTNINTDVRGYCSPSGCAAHKHPCGTVHHKHHHHLSRRKFIDNDYHYYDYAEGTKLITFREQVKHFLEHNGHCHPYKPAPCPPPMPAPTPIFEDALEHAVGHICHEVRESVGKAQCALSKKLDSFPIADIATKDDIEFAITNVNEHFDNKINEIDFETKFSDLNEMISNLNN